MWVVNEFMIGTKNWRLRIYAQPKCFWVNLRQSKYTSDSVEIGYDFRKNRPMRNRPRAWFKVDV